MVKWSHDKVHDEYRPTLYPGESAVDWNIPEEIANDYHKLNARIENKYSKEFLKICAFYNKMFPSLKTSDWNTCSYNAPPFTAMDQERTDTGNGTNYNYLKQIVDQLTSRLGTISFLPKLLAEEQSYEYIIYKDEVERVLRMLIQDDKLNAICIQAFHNAAVLGYSHVFIDPYTGSIIKANDYELATFDGQFNHRHIKQMLYRDYAFPVTDTFVYINELEEDDLKKEVLESLSGRIDVDFTMYFDCIEHKCYVTINGKTLPPKEYPFDYVLMTTFQWDTAFAQHMTSSLFDLLYPIQREINRIAAKKQQIIRNYKGSVPVFNSDVDLSMKAISNGSGEALFIDSTRSTAELMTVINPTPLDPSLDTEIQSHKTTMYELAGIQNASFDMENMRSAAAVVALDQTRDSVFQAQLAGLAQFIRHMLKLYIDYLAVYPDKSMNVGRAEIDWATVSKLIDQSYINMLPVHNNDPLSDESKMPESNMNYSKNAISRIVLSILKGESSYSDIPYFLDADTVTKGVAGLLLKFQALGIDIPLSIHVYLMDAYIDAIRKGSLTL